MNCLVKEVFFISNILQFEMIHFIGQLQYYIHFEISETSWAVFAEKAISAPDEYFDEPLSFAAAGNAAGKVTQWEISGKDIFDLDYDIDDSIECIPDRKTNRPKPEVVYLFKDMVDFCDTANDEMMKVSHSLYAALLIHEPLHSLVEQFERLFPELRLSGFREKLEPRCASLFAAESISLTMIEVVDSLLSAAFPSVELFFSFLIPLLPASNLLRPHATRRCSRAIVGKRNPGLCHALLYLAEEPEQPMIMAPQLMLANSAHMPGMAGAPNPFGQPEIGLPAKLIRQCAIGLRMKRKESDESPSSGRSGRKESDESPSSGRSGRIKQPVSAASVKTSQKDSQGSKNEPARTRSSQIHVHLTPEKSQATTQESLEDSQRLSQLSRYEMMERAAEFSQPSPYFKSPEKTSNNSKLASDLDPDQPTPISDDPLEGIEKLTQAALASSQSSENTLRSEEGIAGISVSFSGELFNDEVPSDPEISLSVSGELFDDELQPMDTTQISQQEEDEGNSSQGSSVYETPEKSLPKTPSKTDQSAPASPPQPPRKLRRSLFNENQEEPMDTPEIIMASSGDTTGRSKKVEMKDSWSQVSGETLRETEGRKRRTHDVQNLCAEESQGERNQTQRVGDLLNHSALVLDSQQSAQTTQAQHESTSATQIQPRQKSQGTNKIYFPPPTSSTLKQASATQKTFDEDLDDDYFAKLKSPTRNADIKKINKQADQAKQQKRVNRRMPRSRAKPTRDEVKKSVAEACRKAQAGGISRRLELARAFISRRNRARDSSDPLNRELENATSWEPKVPNANFSQKRVNRKMPRSTAKPTRDEVKESVAKACRKLQAGSIKQRLEFARAFILRRKRDPNDPLERELEKATSWEPKVPKVNFSKPVPGSSSRFKKRLPVAEKLAKEKPTPSKSKASKSLTKELSAKPKGKRNDEAENQPTCSKNLTPPAMPQDVDLSSFLDSSEDEEVRREVSREECDEKTIIIKDAKNIQGRIGFRLNESSEAGIYINGIIPGSAADKAGLRVGDTLICFNGVKCSVKSKIKLSMLRIVIAETATEDFEFKVIRDVSDQYSQEENVDTSEVSDIPDAEPAKEKPGPSKSKSSESQSQERSQPREEQESAHNWSQQVLFDESPEDRQALSPEYDQSPPAPIDREDVRESMFPTSKKRKLQTPEKDAQGEASAKVQAAKRSKHEKENITPKKSASKPTTLTPAVDNTNVRRPGRDALSEISDLSSAFDNDSPIRGVGKMKQSQKKATKEKSAKLRHDEPTCSKNLTPPAMPPDADLSSFLDSSEDEEVPRPQSRPRRSNRSPTASMPKLTKSRSPEKSPSPSKSKKKPISMKKNAVKTRRRNPRPESIASNQREESDESSRPATRAASSRKASRAASSQITKICANKEFAPVVQDSKRKNWTDDEDAKLIEGLNQYGKDWKTIEKKFFRRSKRTNVQLKDRHRVLLDKGDPRVKEKY
ncbi:Oidioi.mRNA.OKI2018_I69.chr1.g3931.t1.cds [Oikopleura dioica]|uniref:Oidioi.mRNA.OKI2018_I69.chr1.g3931.t1.cds n=1 Tax=Oikopleura dioica TaxID=34765 RepID=A0ABN7SZX9_OIKDI|nr:Oidioi.mRNA.OKI2018_I69.chr1.g3931.t1.cds [Oikopleura dioica]